MNNRIPIIVLIALVFLALVWRLGNPPEPPPPGPYGKFPGWRSTDVLGEMGGCSVNPPGTAWAGAWNGTGKAAAQGSSVWVIDFAAYEARLCKLSGTAAVTHLSWQDKDTIRALRPESNETIVYIDAKSARVGRSQRLDAAVRSVLCWPAGSERLVAEMQAPQGKLRLAALTPPDAIEGKQIEVDLPPGGKLHPQAALSPDGSLFVFSIADKRASAGRAFYLADTVEGAAKPVFDLGDLPGKVEKMWVGESGILIACSERDAFKVVLYDPAQARIVDAPKGGAALEDWPDVEREMMFVTYNGGYSLDLASGRARRLFDLTMLDEREAPWREAVRDGRLYSVGDHYVSVSMTAGVVDIREINKNGTAGRRLLAKF